MMARNWRLIICSALAISCAIAIFIISSIPKVPLPPGYYEIPNADKLLHTLEYFVFGILLCLAFHYTSNPKVSERVLHFSLIIGIVYGITDEVHQAFVPGRTASVMDLAFNSLGVALALLIFFAWRRWKTKKEIDEEKNPSPHP